MLCYVMKNNVLICPRGSIAVLRHSVSHMQIKEGKKQSRCSSGIPAKIVLCSIIDGYINIAV